MHNYYIKPIEKSIAKEMIIKNHYSHCWTKCSLALGIFQKTGIHNFFDFTDDILLGCALFGDPIGVDAANSIAPNVVKQGEVWELTRLWIADATPKNTESWFISQCIKYIEKNHRNIKCLISYADPEFNHLGIIYQSTNWIFQEVGIKVKRWCLSFSDNPYKWIHPKTIMDKYDCNGKKDLRNKVPKPYWLKTTGRKYRYIYILGNKTERRHITKHLKHPVQKYPKTIEKINNEIICVTE